MVNRIVLVVVALLVSSALLPTAIDNFTAVDTSGWDTSLGAVWDFLPVIGLLGVFYLFWRSKGSA